MGSMYLFHTLRGVSGTLEMKSFYSVCSSFSLIVSIWKQVGTNLICTASTTTASLATARGLCAVSITDHHSSAIL